MSRVHDALRRAEKLMPQSAETPEASAPETHASERRAEIAESVMATVAPSGSLIEQVHTIPFTPAPEALLLDMVNPQEAPGEEFRSLRTRLNHLQSLQPIHTVVVTSPSPAEGKSFVAANLALAQAQLAGNNVLLVDFDFRRPVVHHQFQIERAPGATDYLLGNVPLESAVKHVDGTNLYVLPAGTAVKNPLELLNLRQVKMFLQDMPNQFNWVILDSPPLLFSADANLLGTLTDGTVLVVRIGATTIDMVTRSMQSLCENNVLGVVVNGARAGELYSKYTYYYSSYGYKEHEDSEVPEEK